MRVKCVRNRLDEITESGVRDRLRHSIHLDGPIGGLIIGRDYPVQALEQWNDGGLWLYLHTVPASDYPYPYPAELFEFQDNCLPTEWSIRLLSELENVTFKRITFSAWASDDSFYERLVDGNVETIALYRQRMRK